MTPMRYFFPVFLQDDGDGCILGRSRLGQNLQGLHRGPARLPLDGQAQGRPEERTTRSEVNG